MPYDVKLPDIGEGIAEGEIVRWMVKVGDAVKDDQPLVEVMTDKASVEIPSPRTGTIAAIHAEAGTVVSPYLRSRVAQASSAMMTWKPRSEAARAVASTHMWVIMPATITRSISQLLNNSSSPVFRNALD